MGGVMTPIQSGTYMEYHNTIPVVGQNEIFVLSRSELDS